MKVKSHDFRVTQATLFYKETKDLIKTQNFIGHKNAETTRGYIKIGREE